MKIPVSTFGDKYGSQIKYNISEDMGSNKKNTKKHKQVKYNPLTYTRVGDNLFEGVNVMSIAKYLFTDSATTQFLIKKLPNVP